MHYVRDSCPLSFLLNRPLSIFSGKQRFLTVFFVLYSLVVLQTGAEDLDDAANTRTPKISGQAPGELIVRFKATATEDKKAKSLKKVKGVARDLIAPSARIARAAGQPVSASESLKVLKVDGDVAAARATLEKDPDVLYVEPNFK